MAAHDDELTMADMALTHTDPDTTVTPVRRTVTLYARGDLFADLSALETRYDEAKRAANVEDMRGIKEQIREVADQIRASALDITVQGRSADWVQRFRADLKERGVDGDQATLEQLAAQITAPEGFTVDMLVTLRDRIEPQVVALVQAAATVNTMKPTISVPS